MATPSDEMNTELNYRRYEDYPRDEGVHSYDNDEMIYRQKALNEADYVGVVQLL